MDYSHIAIAIQSHEQQDPEDNDNLDNLHLDSQLLLSKISFQQNANQSPQINVNAVEAKIKELTKTADPPPNKKSKPYCGCGQYYSCTSSLYLHIRSKHKGQPPPGTIGGPKGIVKKPYQQQEDPLVKFEDQDGNRYNYYTPPQKRDQNLSKGPQDLAGLTLDQVVNDLTQDQRKKTDQGQGVKCCKLCGKTYSCNSSLNLHLKRKHQMRRREDGTVQLESRPEDKMPRNFQCTICGLSYGSKSALGLHYNNKHNAKNGNGQLPLDDDKIQKCGCGLIYQSRSALNMHVKKKHGGKYPEGTSEKPNIRSKGRSSENYVIEESDEQHPSIYDSDSDGKGHKSKKITEQLQLSTDKIYRCGCGRNYSCSSSLNLHIKKNHNWVVPKGTIGGPRGMRTEEDKPSDKSTQKEVNSTAEKANEKSIKTCQQCKSQLKGQSYFECQNCDDHRLCSKCFWKDEKNNIYDDEHPWTIIGNKK